MEPYKITEREVGMLAKQKVSSVDMPRKRFLEIVEEELQNELYAPIREEMLSTARTMQRFPLSTWVNEDRGCGCVVGEYLIARSEMERAEFFKENSDKEGWFVGIDILLDENPLGHELSKFGVAIDNKMITEVMHIGAFDEDGELMWLDDRGDVLDVVESIEIID